MEQPAWLVPAFTFVFGATVGSFLNVVIARVPRGLSIVRPGSRCPGCERPIRWYENIPILSWIALRGRCAGCKERISIRYPLVELASGLLALACLRQFGLTPWSAACFAFLAALLALTYIDLDHWLLPRAITVPFIALGLGASLLPGGPGIVSSSLGAAAGFASFLFIGYVAERILKKEALGGGDVWLFSMIGSWVGVGGLIPVALLASLQGAIAGLLLIALTKSKERETALPPPKPTGDEELDAWEPPAGALPFGPFLALGAAEFLFFGGALLDWYLGLFR